MSFFDQDITLEDFQSSNVNAIFELDKIYNAHDLEKLLYSHIDSIPFKILASVASMMFDPSDSVEPYKARFFFEDKRGIIPNDFPKEILEILRDFYLEIDNKFLKAKIADLLWIRKVGKIDSLIIAISNFKDTGELLIKKNDLDDAIKVFHRSLYLCSSVRKSNSNVQVLFLDTVNLLQQICLSAPDITGWYLRLIDMLIDFAPKDIDLEKLKKLLERSIINAQKDKSYFLEERLYCSLLRLSNLMKDKELTNEIYKEISKCFLKQAEGKHGLVAASFVKRAIESLRNVKDSRNERISLYELMRDYQRDGMESSYVIPRPSLEVKEVQEIVTQKVLGKDLFDTLMRFAVYINFPEDIGTLKEQVEEELKNTSLLSDIFSSEYIDHDAIPVAKIPPKTSDQNSEKISEILVKKLQDRHEYSVVNKIYPMLCSIIQSYHLDEEYFYDLFRNNPFIPEGHLSYFAKGIFAGFRGDFLTACHLLVPQIENSLRSILEYYGKEPTTLYEDDTQERDALKKLLNNSIIQESLTLKISENLRILLLDKVYGDHRNQISHGYMPSNYYYKVPSIYLWWLIFHILMIVNYSEWKDRYNS